MKVIATQRFIHGAINAQAGDEVDVPEPTIRELEAAGLVRAGKKAAPSPENKQAPKPANKSKET